MARKTSKKPASPKAIITFRHNFLPVLVGVLMFAAVLGLLNSQWLVAQANYRLTPPATAASIDAIARAKAPANSQQLSIPALGVNAPVVYEPSMKDWKIQIALRSGVVHLGSTALPGENGNVVIVGHSSQVVWAHGNYKFVFTLLDKLKSGDRIFVDYQGTRYIYRVTGSQVVDPSDISVIQPTSTPELTLITCTPVGTSTNRLVIHAKQISPKPTPAKNMATQPAASSLTALPR